LRELRKVLVRRASSSEVYAVMLHCFDRISPRSVSLPLSAFNWLINPSSISVPSLRELRYSSALKIFHWYLHKGRATLS
jgi:hypothetical protein